MRYKWCNGEKQLLYHIFIYSLFLKNVTIYIYIYILNTIL
jgi:hypothetical protein